MASCTVSVMSVLSSTAREHAINSLLFSFNCARDFVDISQTRSAIVFLLRLAFYQHLHFVWTQDVADFDHEFLQKLSLGKGPPGLAISSATIKLAFTAASHCDFALVKNVC